MKSISVEIENCLNVLQSGMVQYLLKIIHFYFWMQEKNITTPLILMSFDHDNQNLFFLDTQKRIVKYDTSRSRKYGMYLSM